MDSGSRMSGIEIPHIPPSPHNVELAFKTTLTFALMIIGEARVREIVDETCGRPHVHIEPGV
jgi:hypothetical protein